MGKQKEESVRASRGKVANLLKVCCTSFPDTIQLVSKEHKAKKGWKRGHWEKKKVERYREIP